MGQMRQVGWSPAGRMLGSLLGVRSRQWPMGVEGGQASGVPEGPVGLAPLPLWQAQPPDPLPSLEPRFLPEGARRPGLHRALPCPALLRLPSVTRPRSLSPQGRDAGVGPAHSCAPGRLPVFLFQKGGVDPNLWSLLGQGLGSVFVPQLGELWPVWLPECCGFRRPSHLGSSYGGQGTAPPPRLPAPPPPSGRS